MDRGFFIILDRLHITLDKQINQWAKEQKKFRGGFLGIGRNKVKLKELLVQRLTVAYDLAAAFMYLHENRCVPFITSFARVAIDRLDGRI